MELMLVLRVLVRRWPLIVIPTVIAAIITLPRLFNVEQNSGGFTTTIRYSAAQELNLPERDGDYQDVWLASELTVNAFTDWVRSSSFRGELERALGAEDINLAPLSIAADNARSVGVVYLSHTDRDSLEKIAYASIDVLQTRTQDYFPQLGGQPARVTLLDEPLITSAPPPLANRFEPFFRIALGLFAGLGLAFVVEYLDPTLYDRDELEKQGFRVLASVPKYRE